MTNIADTNIFEYPVVRKIYQKDTITGKYVETWKQEYIVPVYIPPKSEFNLSNVVILWINLILFLLLAMFITVWFWKVVSFIIKKW